MNVMIWQLQNLTAFNIIWKMSVRLPASTGTPVLLLLIALLKHICLINITISVSGEKVAAAVFLLTQN